MLDAERLRVHDETHAAREEHARQRHKERRELEPADQARP